jgi:hypothetical protein
MIFERMPIEWRTHAAPSLTPESGRPLGILSSTLENMKTVRYLIWAKQMEQCQP